MFRLLYFLCVIIFILYVSCASQQKERANEYIQQGNIHYTAKEYDAALENFNEALRFDNTLELKIKIVDIYLLLEEYSQARSMLDSILQQDKDNEIVQELNAYYYLLTEENEKAIELYISLLEDTKYQLRALSNLGVLYARIGNFRTSYDYFQQAIQIADINVKVLESYFRVLLELYNDQSNTTKTQATVVLDIQFVIERVAVEYRQKNISFEEVRHFANMLLESRLSQYAYSLYIFLVQEIEKELNTSDVSDNNEDSFVEVESDTIQDNQYETPAESIDGSIAEGTPAESEDESIAEGTPAESGDESIAEETPAESGDESVAEETPAESGDESVAEETPAESGDGESGEVLSESDTPLVSEVDNDDSNKRSELTEIFFVLAQILFDSDYDIIVPQRFLRGLQYLESALEAGYGATQRELDTLRVLLDRVPTDVLRTRILRIYDRYAIDIGQ